MYVQTEREPVNSVLVFATLGEGRRHRRKAWLLFFFFFFFFQIDSGKVDTEYVRACLNLASRQTEAWRIRDFETLYCSSLCSFFSSFCSQGTSGVQAARKKKRGFNRSAQGTYQGLCCVQDADIRDDSIRQDHHPRGGAVGSRRKYQGQGRSEGGCPI